MIEKRYTMRKRKMSKRAERYIQRKVRKLRHRGYRPRQSVTLAYEMAREKGYKIPRRNRQRR